MNSNIGSNQIKQEQKLKDEEKRKEKEEETAKNEIKNIKKGNKKTEKVEKQIKSLNLHPRIQQFISFIYNEATNAMTSTITVQITPEGIKTPLGILTLDQIQKGEDCKKYKKTYFYFFYL